MKRKAVTYTVDKIVDQKVENGKKYYLVKWDGYDSDSNTWEPERNIECPTLIEAFNRSLANGNRQSDVRKQGRPKSAKTPEPEIQKTPNDREWEATVTTADVLHQSQGSSESTAQTSKALVIEQKGTKAKAINKGKVNTDLQDGCDASAAVRVDMTAGQSAGKMKSGRNVAVAKRTGPPLVKRRRVGPYKGRKKEGILPPVKTPVEIIGASPENGTTMFLTRFEGTDDVEFISRDEAVKLYPQLVINFYCSKIQWIIDRDREWMCNYKQAK